MCLVCTWYVLEQHFESQTMLHCWDLGHPRKSKIGKRSRPDRQMDNKDKSDCWFCHPCNHETILINRHYKLTDIRLSTEVTCTIIFHSFQKSESTEQVQKFVHEDDEEEEAVPLFNPNAFRELPQSTDQTTDAIDTALKDLTPRLQYTLPYIFVVPYF